MRTVTSHIITARDEVAKVMFLHVSVILFTGGVETQPPRKQTATIADSTHPTGMHSCFLYHPSFTDEKHVDSRLRVRLHVPSTSSFL